MHAGSLLVVVLLRTAHYNMSKLKDVYMHQNTLAALANIAPHMSGISAHPAQRLVSLFDMLSRRCVLGGSPLQSSIQYLQVMLWPSADTKHCVAAWLSASGPSCTCCFHWRCIWRWKTVRIVHPHVCAVTCNLLDMRSLINLELYAVSHCGLWVHQVKLLSAMKQTPSPSLAMNAADFLISISCTFAQAFERSRCLGFVVMPG